jgi:hypothetical protein
VCAPVPRFGAMGGIADMSDVRRATHQCHPDRPLDCAAREEFTRGRLPWDRPYVILGESFSGPIAVALAAAPPPRMTSD